MEYFFNGQEMQKMFKKEILPTGAKLDINKLSIPISIFLQEDFQQQVWLYEVEKFTVVGVNQKGLDYFCLESQHELENQDAYYLQKKRREQNPNVPINFADKAESELLHVLSTGKSQIFPPSHASTIASGHCILNLTMRTPVYEDDKPKAILCIKSGVTKFEPVDVLYENYKKMYSHNMQQGNALFLDYLGLQHNKFVLTTREIETLIAIARNHTHKDAARELDLASGTMSSYISTIKNKLQNQNLNDILLYFTTNNKRKF